MKLLLVAAIQTEIEPLLSQFKAEGVQNSFKIGHNIAEILITGVGMVATAFAMGQHLVTNRYDLAINLGIAGSFDFNLAIGDVVQVTEDVFAEQGAEDGENFLPLDKLGFGQTRIKPIQPAFQLPNFPTLKQVRAITVNKVHGSEFSIAKTMARFNPQIESMEGAAFFYACNQLLLPCIQIRAISNYIERRNREKWDIGLAIRNLNVITESILKMLS